MGLAVLKEVVQFADPGAAAPGAMPPDELRFAIEYAARPEVAGVRAQLMQALGSEKFLLEELFPKSSAPLDRFLLLRIAGVQRTLQADVLFAAAYDLASLLGAVSVEPDVGSRFYEESAPPVEGARTEAANAVRRWCNVEIAAPGDHLWAVNSVRAPEAWAADPKQGAAILVAQPDTGVVPTHAELAGMLDTTRQLNVLEPGTPPLDPLSSKMANPGHGTATSSCVASRAAGAVTGSAPGALVVPIRCINDVKIFDGAPVARAIEHARSSGCHVITMSLGGVPSRAVHAALKAAVDANLIVLAAAGNCVRFVVWPARYDECIAVAGINVDDKPWKGSCRGDAVDISAPAENVWKADARTNDATPGQGTSFAVATVAGVAALWLAHHGRAALIAEASARGIRLQRLFRSALVQTARRPAGWNAKEFGAGVVDAQALLALVPGKIVTAKKESAAPKPAASEIEQLLSEVKGELPKLPAKFDWPRYGLELANVAMERARRERRGRAGAATEAGSQAWRPSRELAKALKSARSPALKAMSRSRPVSFVPPPREVPPMTAKTTPPASGALGVLAMRARNDTRESAGRLSREQARTALKVNGDTVVGGALARLDKLAKKRGPDRAAARLIQAYLKKHGSAAISALASSGNEASLNPTHRVATEALVKLTDRPALRVKGDQVDFKDPEIGSWFTPLVLIQNEIPDLVRAVGRIDVEGTHVGTGFLVADDLVMTNRHVLEEIASPLPTAVNPDRWVLSQAEPTIDFAREAGAKTTRKFVIKEVVFAGPNPTNDTEFVDFTDLDLAVLRIEKKNASGQDPPMPLRMLKGAVASHDSQDVLVIGFPAMPVDIPTDAAGKERSDVIAALARIFRMRFGVKYLSPGGVTAQPGSLAGDSQGWVFGHDSTTLGGNSGSCVIRFGPVPAVIGLHFAGEFEKANFAHALFELAENGHLPRALSEKFTWVEE